MITIQIPENQLSTVVKALQKHANRKRKNVERWNKRKEEGLISPLEVADHFIEIDSITAENCQNIIFQLETLNAAI